MELRSHITLSKAHQKTLQIFPYFFIPALNEFYFLKDDLGFKKPDLTTWKNEANLTFESNNIEITVAFETPNLIEIIFKRLGVPGRIYSTALFKKINVPVDKDFLTVQERNDLSLVQEQIAESLQQASTVLKANWKQVTEYLSNASSLSNFNEE